MTPSIIFDFDGTIATGDGPVRSYARFAAPAAGAGYLDRVERALADFAAGPSAYRDGYDIVGSLAQADGVDAETLERAYHHSREHLGTDEAPVEVFPEMAAFLRSLRAHAHLILATNAPDTGIDRVLRDAGVDDLFHESLFGVGKPAGLTPIATRAIAQGPVLAIGDIAVNDLAPVAQLGGATALVGATASFSPVSVTMRGASLADLRSEIETWVATAASSTPAPAGAHTSTER